MSGYEHIKGRLGGTDGTISAADQMLEVEHVSKETLPHILAPMLMLRIPVLSTVKVEAVIDYLTEKYTGLLVARKVVPESLTDYQKKQIDLFLNQLSGVLN